MSSKNLQQIIDTVNQELKTCTDEDLRNFYFDRRVNELKDLLNQYLEQEDEKEILL